ncbi:reverse transcriptase domain-containing protein [Tanacetum coccineum]
MRSFVPKITWHNIEIKHGLLNLVQTRQLFGLDKEEPTCSDPIFQQESSLFDEVSRNVPEYSRLSLCLFPSSLRGSRPDSGLIKSPLDRFLHGLSYSLNSAGGGNFLDKMPRECLKIIESKSKVRQSRSKVVVAKVSTSSSTPTVSPDVPELKDMVRALILDKKNQTPAPVKAVEQSCVRELSRGNTVTNPKEELKGITTEVVLHIKDPQFLLTSSYSPKSNESCPRGPNLNENCSAVILNKLPKKLGDPGRFLIPCEFSGINSCNALADLGASINLMPYSVWKDLSLPELTPTCMTLELADRSITEPIGIAKDVRLMVGKFQFPADFVVVEFEPDPRVPLILGRSFLKTSRALIDVYEGEITLRVGKEAITFNLDQTSRYTANYNHMTANRIDVIELACEEYSQEVLGFSDVVAYNNPSPYYDPVVSNSSPTLTPFGDSDFLLFEEADAFLSIDDEPVSPGINATYYDPEGDVLLLEAILNSEPLPPLPNHKDYSPGIQREIKMCEAKTVESSIDEPPEVELKDLPPHLEYAFLEGDNKLPVINC